jgi:pimeloyl-ACP methyl ester carboxylesterase
MRKEHPFMGSERVTTQSLHDRKRLSLLGLVISLVGLLAVLAATRATESHAASGRSAAPPKATIVLVHGAWADSSSWSRVVGRLQADGYTVDVPPNPLRRLSTDAASIADFLDTIPGPIVLVGHSYGGAVISNAARGNPNVKALVFIDAFIPAKGETVLQLAGAQPGSCLGGGGDPTKVFNLVPYPGAAAGDFELYAKSQADPPYPGFAKCFANDLPAAEAAILAATQRPVTLSAVSQPSGAPAWKAIPSWALVGTLDNVLPPAEQLFMAQRAHAHIAKVPAGHLLMISHPGAVTRLIVRAVNALPSPSTIEENLQ